MPAINADNAFECFYDLFQAKPWLNAPGIMTEADHHAEDEALSFLLTLEVAASWGNCSESAKRVVNSLLLDFMAKLQGPFSRLQWEMPDELPGWQQAAKIIAVEIRKSHPRLSNSH